MDPEIYAKVENGQITQYPLTLQDINNVNDATASYYICYFEAKPTFDPVLQTLVDNPRLLGAYVTVSYTIESKTLEEIFAQIGLGSGSSVTINEVDPSLLNAVTVLIRERTQKLLDDFAATRDYDGIRSACTYANSQITQFQQDALRAIYLRDLTWSSLNTYLNSLLSGSQPLPASWDDVLANIPTLTWS